MAKEKSMVRGQRDAFALITAVKNKDAAAAAMVVKGQMPSGFIMSPYDKRTLTATIMCLASIAASYQGMLEQISGIPAEDIQRRFATWAMTPEREERFPF